MPFCLTMASPKIFRSSWTFLRAEMPLAASHSVRIANTGFARLTIAAVAATAARAHGHHRFSRTIERDRTGCNLTIP